MRRAHSRVRWTIEGHLSGTSTTDGSWRRSSRPARDVRPALQHAGAAARAGDGLRRLDRSEHADAVADDPRPRARAARRWSGVRGARPHPADPRLAGRVRRGCARLCGRADLVERCSCCASLEGVALAGLPAVATAYLREELHASPTPAPQGSTSVAPPWAAWPVGCSPGGVGEFAGWRWALAAAGVLGRRLRGRRTRVLLPPSTHFVPSTPRAPRGARAARRGRSRTRHCSRSTASAGCSMGMLVAVFNTLGFRLEAAPFHLGIGAASLVFLVYPLGTVSSAVSGSWPTGSAGARYCRRGASSPWPASC